MSFKCETDCSNRQTALLAGTFAISAFLVLADAFIHPGGVSNALNRSLFPESIRDYLGNPAPLAIMMTPSLLFYAYLKQCPNRRTRQLADHFLKFALAAAFVAGGDIELVTSRDVPNPQAIPDFLSGGLAALTLTYTAKSIIDKIIATHPKVVNWPNTDLLFDQPNLYHPQLATSADQIFR